jgi:hypothetical protein
MKMHGLVDEMWLDSTRPENPETAVGFTVGVPRKGREHMWATGVVELRGMLRCAQHDKIRGWDVGVNARCTSKFKGVPFGTPSRLLERFTTVYVLNSRMPSVASSPTGR